MRLLIFTVAVLLACSQLAGAADVAVTAVSEPATIRATYQQTSQSGHIIISTTAEKGLPALSLRAWTLTSGNAFATVGFPGNGGKDSIELAATPELKRDIPIDITGLDVPGSYTGKVDVTVTGQTTGTVVTIAVTRDDPNFAPVVGGPAYKDSRITITAADSSEPASFTVQLPTNNRKRELEIVLGQSLSEGMTVTPQRFTALPGEQRVVFLALTDKMKLGTLTGTLTIRDVAHPDLAVELFVSATKVRNTTWRTILLLSFVLGGALVSVLFNNIFPVSLAKRRNRQALTECEAAIRACGTVSTTLRSALFAEAARLRLVNGSFSWYSTTKAEQIQQVRTLLKVLQDCVDAANSISNQRAMAAMAGPIPIRLLLQVEDKLTTAENNLVDRKLDAAKAKVDEAANLLTNGSTPANLAVLRTDLIRDIEKLLDVAGAGDQRPDSIAALVAKLEAARQIPEGIEAADLLKLERDHYIARTFICDFEHNRIADSNLAQFEAKFLSSLRDDTTSTTTRLLISLAQQKLAPADVAAAITPDQARIETADKIQVYEMGDFRFVFKDPALQRIGAARRLCTYEWNFRDGTVTPPSDFCRHFFLAPRRGGLYGRIRGWLGALVRWLVGGERPEQRRDITVTVTPPLNTGEPTPFNKTITLLPKQDHGFGAIGIEVATFFVSFFMAVCAAFGTQYATLPTADSLSVFITAFLFGFGLDQIRDKTTTAAAQH